MDIAVVRKITPRVLLPFLDRIEESAGGFRLARGMFWSIAGAVSSRAFALFASVIVARVLGKSVFGEFGIVQSTNNMFMTFANAGVGLTATKYVAEFRKNDPQRAGRIIAMSTLAALFIGSAVGVIMIATSPWVARLLAAPDLQIAIAVSSLALIFIVINDAQNGALTGFEAFKKRSIVQLTAAIIGFPITVAGVYMFGLLGAIYGLIASQAVLVWLNYWAIQKEAGAAGVAIRWREAKTEVEVFLKFSLPALYGGILYVPAMWIANMILVKTPGGYAQMGVFSAADRWRTAIVFLPTMLGSVTLPMLASLKGEADSQKYHKLLRSATRSSAMASLAVAAPVALLAPWIMAMYGPGFQEGAWVLITLCIAAVSFAAYWILAQALVSQGRMWTMFVLNLAWAVTLLTSIWLMRGRGAQGLALAYLMADTTHMVAAWICANRMPSR